MSQTHLVPNTTKIFPIPDFCIYPGDALYDPSTKYIHLFKYIDPSKPLLEPSILQLYAVKVAEIHKNRAIGRVLGAIVSAFGINEVVDLVFDNIDLPTDYLADIVSNSIAQERLGYYNIQTNQLILDFPLVMPKGSR